MVGVSLEIDGDDFFSVNEVSSPAHVDNGKCILSRHYVGSHTFQLLSTKHCNPHSAMWAIE